MDYLRHQKYKNKQLKNSNLELEDNFNPIKLCINDMDKFEKKRNYQRLEHLQKALGMIGSAG